MKYIKFPVLFITCTLIMFSCKEKNTTVVQMNYSVIDILNDDSKPVLNNSKEEHINYYKSIRFISHVSFSDEKLKETSLLYLTNSNPYLMNREHISAISITLIQKSDPNKISLNEAKKFAIQLLPKAPPLKAEYLESYPHKNLSFTLLSESLYYQKSKNSIIYSAKFQSQQKEPTLSGKEGVTPYYENILISMDVNSNMVITVGGPGLKLHSRSYDEYQELKISLLTDVESIKNILTSGLTSGNVK